MNSRRKFFQTASVATLGIISAPNLASAALGEQEGSSQRLKMKEVILFQGDSITDGGRDRTQLAPNNSQMLGSAYPILIAGDLLSKYPKYQIDIFNKGISGNKVFQLAERWDADCLAIKPTVLTILIGVNDFWHTLTQKYTGTVQTYRDDYKKLLTRTREALPDTRLILMEPFAVKDVKAVDAKWYPAFDDYRNAALEIAQEFKASFVPLQKVFDNALDSAPGAYWTRDGVHPTIAGEGLIASAWLKTFKA